MLARSMLNPPVGMCTIQDSYYYTNSVSGGGVNYLVLQVRPGHGPLEYVWTLSECERCHILSKCDPY